MCWNCRNNTGRPHVGNGRKLPGNFKSDVRWDATKEAVKDARADFVPETKYCRNCGKYYETTYNNIVFMCQDCAAKPLGSFR